MGTSTRAPAAVVERSAAEVGRVLGVSATAARYLYPAVVEAYCRYQLTGLGGDSRRDSLMVTVLLEAGRTGRNLGRVDLHELWLQTAPSASGDGSTPGPPWAAASARGTTTETRP